VVCVSGQQPNPIVPTEAAQQAAIQAAIQQIQVLGGRVLVDASRPGSPVVSVDLAGTQVTDAHLAALREFDRLQTLNLTNTGVTDTGLQHLKGLNHLETLHLQGAKGITDTGLAHLHGLAGLRHVTLTGTRATNNGIQGLQKALSRARIHH